jgi:hypothetical protein
MIGALSFVAVGIVDGSPVQAFRYLVIKQGRLMSSNGFATFSAPVALDLDAVVPGALFIAAIKACKEAPRFSLSPDRARLSINSGNLDVALDCLPEGVPLTFPSGYRVDLAQDVRPALRRVLPFVSLDTSKRWACSASLQGGSLLATNNVTIAEVAMPVDSRVVCTLPRSFIEAVLRVKAAPVALSVSTATVTAHYPSGSWIMSKTYADAWPNVGAHIPTGAPIPPLPSGFFDALDTLSTLANGVDDIAIDMGYLTLLKIKESAASIRLDGLPMTASRWSLSQLRALRDLATHADLGAYPAPAAFMGEGARGAIAGKSGKV